MHKPGYTVWIDDYLTIETDDLTLDAEATFSVEICHGDMPCDLGPYVNSINIEDVRVNGQHKGREWLVAIFGDDLVCATESEIATNMDAAAIEAGTIAAE